MECGVSDVSVIVVSYNTLQKTRKCLRCLENESVGQIIVVDNCSADGSTKMIQSEFPNCKLVALETNIGFGRANNEGLRHATLPLVLFLNSDAYSDSGSVAKLAEVFSDQSIAGAGGRLLNMDRSLQQSIANRLSLRHVVSEQLFLEGLLAKIGHGYWITQTLPSDKISDVPQIMGACLMTRRAYGVEFDPDFFLYCEDSDYCLRLATYGRLVYVPTSTYVHELGGSSQRDRWKSVKRYNRSKVLYFQKHLPGQASLCGILNTVGGILRLLVALPFAGFMPSMRAKAECFWNVLFTRLDDKR